MSNETIFIPKKIKVGFQKRNDTYTKMLAYVIYYDQHGKLRKEASWESWRDKKIDSQEFSNDPVSGFVLNKKVGDCKTDWNHRKAYCRVYDPRGFEFEIDIANLLYILENTNSIKGKGLEGEFVYGWDKGDLVLIPTGSPDYEELVKYNKLLVKPAIKAKDLIVGATYLTNKKEKFVYLGSFQKYQEAENGKSLGEHYYFCSVGIDHYSYVFMKKITNRIIDVVSETPSVDYPSIMDDLETKAFFSPISKVEHIPLSLEKFKEQNKKNNYGYGGAYVLYGGSFHFASIYINLEGTVSIRYHYNNLYSYHKDYANIEDCYNENPFYKKVEYLANGKVRKY